MPLAIDLQYRPPRGRRARSWLAAGCMALLTLASPALAQRVALVVGNAAYADRPLRNPVNDAQLMQATLRGLGFEVLTATNADRRRMLGSLREFEAKARSAEVALFYFAGHGAQVGGNNYLLPVGANIQGETDVPDEAIDAGGVLRRLEEARARVALVILDACRDNPFAGANRSAARGLARMSVPTGTIIAYATAPGSVAADGGGANGVYTEQLARHLRMTQLDLRDVFDRTAQEVERVTNGRQRPREEVGLRGRFYLGQRGNEAQREEVATARPEPAPSPAPTPTGPSAEQIEQQAWEAARSSNSAGAYQAYLQEYPQGRYASAARVALAGLRTPAPPPVAQAPAVNQAGQTIQDCDICPQMVFIPAGSFMMGSDDGDTDEGPVHRVNVPAFLMGRTEVTQGQWKAVMGNNPSRYSQCGDDCPVGNVSWNDAQEYVRRLSQRTGKTYRLPSEAEWEYACRAGGQQGYCGSDNIDEVAWYASNSGQRTQRVAQKRANAWGLYDMSGNVLEWVHDVWHDNYSGAPSDASAWTAGGDQSRRVLRGGSWFDSPGFARATGRGWNSPAIRNTNNGFRVARTL